VAGPEGVTVDTTNLAFSDLGVRGAVRAAARAGLISASALFLVAATGEASPTMGPDSRLIYVSTGGNDSNDGLSPATPKRTLAGAAAAVRDGNPDWIFLRRGHTWVEGFAPLDFSGRSDDEPIVITAYGPGNIDPKIRPEDPTAALPDDPFVASFGVDYPELPDDGGDSGGSGASAPVLDPGDGWVGPTPQPPAVGNPGDLGYDAKAIARWDVVPFQTFDEEFEIGVVAFHINGIDRVEFSVEDGPWVAVREMTLNPRTNAWEYWVKLDASLFTHDRSIEVRAVVVPDGAGEPRLLAGEISGGLPTNGEHSMFLNTNAGGSLSPLVRYVSPTGSDSDGDGTVASPYRTPLKAARSIQDEQGEVADGGIIYLTAGDHVYGDYESSLYTTTNRRWLTLTAAPGVDRADVRLTTTTSGDGLRTKLVRIANISVTPDVYTRLLSSNTPLEDYLWIDSCWLQGLGNDVDEKWTNGWSDIFVTNTSIGQSRDGISGALVRNVTIRSIGSDAFTNSGVVIDSSVHEVDRGNSNFHADVMQYFTTTLIENRIAFGVTSTTDSGQGFFAGENVAVKDIAFIGCNLSNQEGANPTVARIFQFGGPTNHMYVRDCEFRGAANWRFDLGFDPHNIVLENTVFHDDPPGTPSGVMAR
jgi:hypothetical protein